MAEGLYLFGAGREKRIYAVPPHTDVVSLEFEDHRFRVESFENKQCRLCGSRESYLDELIDDANGKRTYQCSDTAFCAGRMLQEN
jgi:alpha-D-ribose 1-methylphosphonate 5-phosphate C-P lyase